MNTVLTLLVAIASAAIAFGAVFLLARLLDNYSVVDIAWSAGFAPVVLWYAIASDGAWHRRATIMAMVALWSLRLAGHLAQRIYRSHPVEDGRYQQLRREWGPRVHAKMFGFFQAQALLLVVLSVPFLLAAKNPSVGWHPLEVGGIVLWAIAFTGETVADAQLSAFKRSTVRRGQVCDRGLWKLSRHPNYFFEWLMWVAFALFAAAAPWGWVSIYCPALMLFFLLRVTGIRYTEDQLVRSKGAAYRRYQLRTSAFIPWFPRAESDRGRHSTAR